MKILVTGSSGSLGSALIAQLRETNHELVATSRTRPRYKKNVEWIQSDFLNGEGLSQALEDVDVVIHAATSPMKQAAVFEVDKLREFLSMMASVKHFIYPSIVGIDATPMKYYRLKLATEHVIEAQNVVPYTIARGTQFHHFVDNMLLSVPVLGRYILPKDVKMQSVAVEEFAAHLIAQIGRGPGGKIADFGGPEVLTVKEMALMKNRASGKLRKVFQVPLPGKVMAALRAGKNIAPDEKHGVTTFETYLNKKYDS